MRFINALSASGLLVMLAACAVSPPDSSLAYRPGTGVVEAVRPARVAVPAGSGAIAGSDAAGGHYGSPLERLSRPRWTEGYQLTLRMDDGASQQVTQDSGAFHVGDRVEVTPEGRVVKTAAMGTPAPASAAPATAAPVAAAAPTPYRPGIATVESASVVSLSSAPSASAGGTSGAATTPTMAYRLRMADGSTQSVVQAGDRFLVGERVQVTGDGQLIRP